METLAMLLGGIARVKVMRLFLFNQDGTFTVDDLVERLKIKAREAKEEVGHLEKAGLVIKKNIIKIVEKKKGKKIVEIKKKDMGWHLNRSFSYLTTLKNLLIGTELFSKEEIIKKLSTSGKLKLVITSGVFIQDYTSRVDLFVVGDHLKKNTLEKVVRNMEAEIGRELAYAYFESSDFKYRLDVCDKLVYDVLDYPHETILDKIGEQNFRSK